MMCTLMLSHGTGGAAMPHGGGAMPAVEHGDHHHDEAEAPIGQNDAGDSAQVKTQAPQDGIADLDIAHVHQVIDITPSVGMVSMMRLTNSLPAVPMPIARLRSERTPPLLKPPLA